MEICRIWGYKNENEIKYKIKIKLECLAVGKKAEPHIIHKALVFLL